MHQFHAFAAYSTPADLRAQLLPGAAAGPGAAADGVPWLAAAGRLPGAALRGVACDVFVALRVIYLACVVQATAMIIRSRDPLAPSVSRPPPYPSLHAGRRRDHRAASASPLPSLSFPSSMQAAAMIIRPAPAPAESLLCVRARSLAGVWACA